MRLRQMAPCRENVAAAPVCPFAVRGVDDAAMRACPGYVGTALSFRGVGAGDSIATRQTCAHLGTQSGRRGFVSACTCPTGLPEGAAEMAQRLPRVRLIAAGG